MKTTSTGATGEASPRSPGRRSPACAPGLLLSVLLFAGIALAPRQAPGQEAPESAAPHAEYKHERLRRPLSAPRHASVASAAFDATYYHLTLDVRFDPDYLYGRTRVVGRVVDAPMDVLVLDFADAMQVDAVRTPEGLPLGYTHALDALTIDLPASQPVGATLAVDVSYQGVPPAGADPAFVFGTRGNGDRYAWTLSEPYGARTWWPGKDHPSDKADSVRVTVTVPEALRVGSNGLLVSETRPGDGTVTYGWRSRYPIAPYLVSLAAGRYDVFEQTYTRPDTLADAYGPLALPLLHYAYRGTDLFEGADELTGWKRVVDVLPVLEYGFGPYPFPDEKYGHAQFTYRGGMEHQTMSSMGGSYIGLVVHELAHMWFGDLVTLRTWPHLWLNEGFATYAELFYYRHTPSEAAAALYDPVFDLYWNRARGAQGTLVVQDTTTVDNLFDGRRVYAKGGLVLHMLEGVVGEAAFRQILRTYSADPTVRYGNATTADFQRVAEAVSGMDLDAFFQQWVTEGTGYPVYDVQWSAAPAVGGYAVTVEIEQTQAPPLSNVSAFAMPVTLAVQTAEGDVRATVWNDRRQQTYTLTTPALPIGLVLDPDRRLLRNEPVTATGVQPIEPGAADGLPAVYPNPAAGTLWVRWVQAASGPTRLTLYDVLGRQVRVLLDRPLVPGTQELAFDVRGLPDGPHFVQLRTETGRFTRSVMLLSGR